LKTVNELASAPELGRSRHAADVERQVAARGRRLEALQVRDDAEQVLVVGDAEFGDRVGGNRGDGDRGGLQVLGALLRGDDDFLESALVGALRASQPGGGCRDQAGNDRR
jgi:hypothetical protein